MTALTARHLTALCLGSCALAAASACGPKPPEARVGVTPEPTGPVVEVLAPSSPVRHVTLESVGLDPSALDRKADACSDFYRFACGGWIDRTQIPEDKARWVRSFNEIDEHNEQQLRLLLEGAAAAKDAAPAQRQLGDFYAACMDEAGLEKLGLQPIQPYLKAIQAAGSVPKLLEQVVELHLRGVWALFDVSAEQDFKDATRYLVYLDQAGLGLPDRDYYLKEDEPSKALLAQYEAHVARMFGLAGQPAAQAARSAKDVLAIETALATVSKTKVERRDPAGLYNKLDRAQLTATSPAFPWDAYLGTLGLGAEQQVNVTAPKFFEGMSELVKRQPLGAWKSYLSWQLLHATAPALSAKFVAESFKLEQLLTGQKEQRVRWKRCVDAADGALGETLAQGFVAKFFPPESKAAVVQMVGAIGQAFATETGKLPWMDPATQRAAREKFAAMAYLIGYPEKWKRYDFPVGRGTHAANLLAAKSFELRQRLARLGKPVDRGEWFMTPPTVNAYYDPQKNQMVFPAGILQPPFYSPTASVAVNLGAMGMVVGHELTHGFDDEGSQFDQNGNLRAWWPTAVRQRYEQQTQCVAAQYSTFEPLPGVKVNGQLTLGENIADMGGVKLAFYAYRALRRDAPERLVADGFTEDQQFFLSTGQLWCAKYREEYARLAVSVDPHSPPRFRVNGPLANLPEFAEAFSCSPGTPMSPKQRCSVW